MHTLWCLMATMRDFLWFMLNRLYLSLPWTDLSYRYQEWSLHWSGWKWTAILRRAILRWWWPWWNMQEISQVICSCVLQKNWSVHPWPSRRWRQLLQGIWSPASGMPDMTYRQWTLRQSGIWRYCSYPIFAYAQSLLHAQALHLSAPVRYTDALFFRALSVLRFWDALSFSWWSVRCFWRIQITA